jgi:hypothetical protein
MRWTPVVLLLIATAVAVIVARGLPEDTSHTNAGRDATPVDAAVDVVKPPQDN